MDSLRFGSRRCGACVFVLPLLTLLTLLILCGCATTTMPDGNKVKVYPPYAIYPDGSIRPDERCWQITMDAAAKVGPDAARMISETVIKASQAQPAQ